MNIYVGKKNAAVCAAPAYDIQCTRVAKSGRCHFGRARALRSYYGKSYVNYNYILVRGPSHAKTDILYNFNAFAGIYVRIPRRSTEKTCVARAWLEFRSRLVCGIGIFRGMGGVWTLDMVMTHLSVL